MKLFKLYYYRRGGETQRQFKKYFNLFFAPQRLCGEKFDLFLTKVKLTLK
jgi:hypothetical protein